MVLLLAAAGGAIVWGILRKNAPPQVRFTRVKRQTLVATLPTNGKVEPFEWQSARAETAGLVSKVNVQAGQRIAAGAPLAELTDASLQGDIDSAQARVSEAQANLQFLEAGGKSSELTEIENSLSRARFDLQTQQKEQAALQRLVEKQAAAPVEVQAAADKVRQLQIEIQGLDRRRATLVAKPEVDAARARLQDADGALRLATKRAGANVVRAPIAGEVYDLAAKRGAYLNVGDLVANVGSLDRMRVRVYVDEPLLGRVAAGQPLTVKWEALPGRQWHGKVERMPTSIQALGSRQVGEVVCVIENPGHDLIPGTNIDAEIRTAVVDNALVIPKETLRRDAAGDYVFVLRDGTIERRAVKTGIATVTQVQVTEGLSDGDGVALPADVPLKPGIG